MISGGICERIGNGEPFSLWYVHSIYGDPVREEFQWEDGGIVLKGVGTKSPAVMGYYGFESTEEHQRMNRRLGSELILRKGMGKGQVLIVKGRRIPLDGIGGEGDRIRLRVRSMSLGEYLLKTWNVGQ